MSELLFLNAVQTRAARIAASSSATRNQGEGVVASAREFLSGLPLGEFAECDHGSFEAWLNASTEQLASALPAGSRSWGLARKLLNIFLRDALYTSYLAEAYSLRKVEHLLEVPLDSISAGRIREYRGASEVPRWRGVKYNTPAVSAAYQKVASEMAVSIGIARVHLDTYWWGGRAEPQPA